jgi:hypothetical protein
MASNPDGDDIKAGNFFVDQDGDVHFNAATVYVEGSSIVTSSTEGATIKGIYTTTLSVTVPSITDPDIAKVDVDTSAMTFQAVVGDLVIVVPTEALPTNTRLQGYWVNATDQVQITYGSEGGNVTGAAKTHKFVFFDLT